MKIEIDKTALVEALLDSGEVKGYCADSPTMAEKAKNVNAFLRSLYAQMEAQK